MSKGYIVFENGTVFTGILHGSPQPIAGEAVFNTSMNGYQEIITDPSYAGQILVMTYPQIGNYGFGEYGFEADKPALQALVVKEMSTLNGHYESRWSFEEFLDRFHLICLSGVDTRAIARMIRVEGSMGAVITGSLDNLARLREQAAFGKSLLDSDLVKRVSRKKIEVIGDGARHIVLWDFGTKQGIIKSLLGRGCRVTAVPAETKADEILSLQPEGLVLSNGPGNPESCHYVTRELEKLIGTIPIFGICLGHQLLALALGAHTYKMTFGHRGGNHTVKDVNGKCYVSSQNHGYAVDADSLGGTGLKVSFINLNDNTVEGLYHEKLPLLSVQFHPEAKPGPQDTGYLFDKFLALTV